MMTMTMTTDHNSYQRNKTDNHQFSVELPFSLARCE